jgi:type II secretory pathway pseudopilin PulG
MNLYQIIADGRINRYSALYTAAVCIGLSGFVILEESVAALGTVTALALVCGISYWAIGRVARRMSEPQLLIIRWIQLLKIAIVLPLVYFHWAPLLTPKPWQAWGYDPQRYFVQAQRWAQAGLAWQARPIGAYVGAVYYYAGLAHVFGPSPAIPALANTLTTLLATLAIIGIARGLVKPDIIWFDCLSSRESLCLFLITVGITAFMSANKHLLSLKISAGRLFAFWIALAGLTLTRATMAVVLVIVLVIQLAMTRQKTYGLVSRLIVVLLVISALIGSAVATLNAGSTISVTNLKEENLIGLAANRESQYVDDSVTRHLATDNPAINALVAPIRSLFYIVNGPNAAIEYPSMLWDPSTAYVQAIASALTGMLNILALPLFVLGMWGALRGGERNAFWAFVVPVIILFLALGYGTQFIQERYRTQVMPLYWAVVWMGLHESPGLRYKAATWSYAAGACAAGVLIAVKMLL